MHEAITASPLPLSLRLGRLIGNWRNRTHRFPSRRLRFPDEFSPALWTLGGGSLRAVAVTTERPSRVEDGAGENDNRTFSPSEG